MKLVVFCPLTDVRRRCFIGCDFAVMLIAASLQMSGRLAIGRCETRLQNTSTRRSPLKHSLTQTVCSLPPGMKSDTMKARTIGCVCVRVCV